MRINVAVPEAHVDAPVLDAMLESVTRLDQKLLQEGAVPTAKEAIKKHGVRWQPEPPGEEHFDHAGTVMQRGHGDCDDLAPHHAASLRHTGEDPGAKAVVYRSGPMRWHAVVQRSDASRVSESTVSTSSASTPLSTVSPAQASRSCTRRARTRSGPTSLSHKSP